VPHCARRLERQERVRSALRSPHPPCAPRPRRGGARRLTGEHAPPSECRSASSSGMHAHISRTACRPESAWALRSCPSCLLSYLTTVDRFPRSTPVCEAVSARNDSLHPASRHEPHLPEKERRTNRHQRQLSLISDMYGAVVGSGDGGTGRSRPPRPDSEPCVRRARAERGAGGGRQRAPAAAGDAVGCPHAWQGGASGRAGRRASGVIRTGAEISAAQRRSCSRGADGCELPAVL